MSARPASPAVYRRRRVTALGVLVALVAVGALAFGRGGDKSPKPVSRERAAAAPTPKPLELPRGGRTILPDFRVVAYYGAPQDRQLGILGIGKPSTAARRLEKAAKPFARKTRPVLPAMELIAVVAAAHPGEGGRYNLRQPDSVIRRYLKAA